jgi:large subunit ribosomal protein L23
MKAYSVLLRPMLTEKSNEKREAENKYSFLVTQGAKKGEIKSAIEKLFGVNVTAVNTMLTRGKVKRRGQRYFLSEKKKKAVISLAAGQKISIFEDQ